jgi:membrane protein
VGFRDDNCQQHAAAIAYFALLSFFPFMLLLASVASVIVGDSPEDLRASLESLRPFLPALDEVGWSRVDQLVRSRSVFSLASLLLLSWLASRVTLSTQLAIATVFHARVPDSPPRRGIAAGLRAWLLTMAVLVALGVVLVAISILEYAVRASPGDLFVGGFLRSAVITRHVVPFALISGIGFVVYTAIPPRSVGWARALAGALTFGALHLLATKAFAASTALAGRRDVIYGSFVGVVSFTAWFYIASCLLLLGAELVAELSDARNPRASQP